MIESRHASEPERVDIARRHVDAAEMWLRRLVQQEMTRIHGSDYFREGVISSAIRASVARVRAGKPDQSTRDIDATSFDDLVRIVTNPEHYPTFAAALAHAYPDGASEAKTYLSRLIEVRNSVHHGNGCTSRQLERAVCYSNDLIDSLKDLYVAQNNARSYNVPTFVRVTDNRGNRADSSTFADAGQFRLCEFLETDRGVLTPSDTLILEVEVDPTFDPADYDITWFTSPRHSTATGARLGHVISDADVAERASFYAKVISKKSWHRYGDYDDQLVMSYKILPPLE